MNSLIIDFAGIEFEYLITFTTVANGSFAVKVSKNIMPELIK
jgi:hypothetical protein